MLSTRSLNLYKKIYHKTRSIHISQKHLKEFENPIKRTLRILGDDIVNYTKKFDKPEQPGWITEAFPRHADVVIIGGGAVGSSIAYWLKEKTGPNGISVVVIEKDPTYKKCSTTLSVGGLRQQFSLPENINMSLFGADFIRTLKKRFGQEADVNFVPHGYLVLASEEGASQLIDNSTLQRELGAVNTILSKEKLKERFPWINTEGVELGCYGLEKEGWFDPWSLLSILKNGAKKLGVEYIHGECVDFLIEEKKDIFVEGQIGNYQGLKEVVVKLPNGEYKTIEFAFCALACGADSGEIARRAKIGEGPGILTVPLPVEKRKRYVFQFLCKDENPPGINTPMTIDYNGTYFRRDGLGGSFLCGLSPKPEDEPNTDNLEVDYQYFDEKVWPNLAKRVDAFNNIKVCGAWGGYYDYNYFDENGIIGCHPYYYNMLIATGFSGHGIQQAPAVGRAVAELILDGKFQTIDLTRFSFNRLLDNVPMYEVGII